VQPEDEIAHRYNFKGVFEIQRTYRFQDGTCFSKFQCSNQSVEKNDLISLAVTQLKFNTFFVVELLSRRWCLLSRTLHV
jgi:hypothetical protein